MPFIVTGFGCFGWGWSQDFLVVWAEIPRITFRIPSFCRKWHPILKDMWRPIKMIEEWTPTGPDVAIVTNNSILPFFTEQSLLYDGFVPLQARSCSPRSPALIILITSRHVRINFFSLQLVSEIRIKSQLGLSNRSGRHILNSSGHFWGLVPFFFSFNSTWNVTERIFSPSCYTAEQTEYDLRRQIDFLLVVHALLTVRRLEVAIPLLYSYEVQYCTYVIFSLARGGPVVHKKKKKNFF